MLQDKITLFPSTSPAILSEERTLIFFIPGNPGLIEYYRPFLSSLQALLSPFSDSSPSPSPPSPHSQNLVFHGTSLPGFELRTLPETSEPGPHDLRATIDAVKRALLHAADEYNVSGHDGSAEDGKAAAAGVASGKSEAANEKFPGEPEVQRRHRGVRKPMRVVLIGHSVGSYILLEVAEWWRKVQAGEAGPKKGVNGAVGAAAGGAMRIVGGVCLFPTVVDIAMSPRGKWIAPLLLVPGLSVLLALATKLIFLFVPTFVLTLFISLVLMEKPAAGVTAAWLKSSHGVRQTVFLGRHEMEEIGADRWSVDIWGSQTFDYAVESTTRAHSKGDRAKLFFFWGENDHWVNSVQRDRLIARRTSLLGQSDEGPPWMEVDTTGLPHSFCVNNESTRYVAEKVAGWIREVL